MENAKPKEKIHKEKVVKSSLVKYKMFILISLFSSMVILLVSNVSEYTSPILIGNGMNVKHTGYIIAASKIVSIILLRNQSKISEVTRGHLFAVVTLVLAGLLFLLFSIHHLYYWIFVICIITAINNFLQPIISERINGYIDSSNRTTMLSISNMLDNMLFFAGDPVLGWSIDKAGYNNAFGAFGILIFLLLMIYIIFRKTRRKSTVYN